jgi:tetratricopeptide (TPR) repeat protein
MTKAQHYHDEALIALLDRGGSGLVAADEHVAACADCKETVSDYETMVGTLREEPVWNRAPLRSEPVPQTIALLRTVAGDCRSEDAAAEPLVAKLTAGPCRQWMARLAEDSRYRTAGVVRKLCAAAEEISGKSPADELALTELATEIADHLDSARYPQHTVTRLRGDAWRTRAYTLDYTGDLNAAMAAVTRARQHYDLLPVADYDIARLELTRALILRHLDRLDEGLEAIQLAGPALRTAADTGRLRTARTIEAAVRRSAGDIHAALKIWCDIETELPVDDPTRAGILHNIAVCHRELGDFDAAIEYYGRAADIAARNGAAAELQRFRWNIGSILLKQQRFADAESILAAVIRQFTDLTMREEAVLARLELTEVLIVQKRFGEAIGTCEDVVAELRASGLEHTNHALIAVTYLQEATRAKRATAALARNVREFVRDAPKQPALLFAPPPFPPEG